MHFSEEGMAQARAGAALAAVGKPGVQLASLMSAYGQQYQLSHAKAAMALTHFF